MVGTVTSIVPGTTERELSDQVKDLANEKFGIREFWHKQIVREPGNVFYRSGRQAVTSSIRRISR